jgi:CBS domain-containing protein
MHVGLLPIVGENDRLVGDRSAHLLLLELPDFINFIADVDFVHDFGAVETTRPAAQVLEQSVTTLMKPLITVNEDSGLLRAYALMLQHNLHDIPVVSKEGKLVGMASRVDIGTAILSTWSKVE